MPIRRRLRTRFHSARRAGRRLCVLLVVSASFDPGRQNAPHVFERDGELAIIREPKQQKLCQN